jgi:putative SOS response-associated peptidase YedK
MCGRFTIISEREVIEKRFHARFADKDAYKPRYNAAPAQNLPVILNTHPKEIRMVKWGLNPPWLKKFTGKDGLINVRAETLKEKKTFSADLEKRRCLILADSFYEWKKTGGKKIPYRILLKNNKLFAFAGIWESDEGATGKKIDTFAIITTTPNELVGKVHNRMPVILSEDGDKYWLDSNTNAARALKVLSAYPSSKMQDYVVSTAVNRVSLDLPKLILPMA